MSDRPIVSERMVRAGVYVLEQLEGEVSRVTLAEQVFLAMRAAEQDELGSEAD